MASILILTVFLHGIIIATWWHVVAFQVMKHARVFRDIAIFLVGAVFGSGSYWEWQKNRLESQKQEIERAVSTTDLREKENDQYAKILDLTNEYINAVNDYSKVPTPQLHNKIAQLKSQLDVIKITSLPSKTNSRSSKDASPGIFQ